MAVSSTITVPLFFSDYLKSSKSYWELWVIRYLWSQFFLNFRQWHCLKTIDGPYMFCCYHLSLTSLLKLIFIQSSSSFLILSTYCVFLLRWKPQALQVLLYIFADANDIVICKYEDSLSFLSVTKQELKADP